jgi:hypothetical protein
MSSTRRRIQLAVAVVLGLAAGLLVVRLLGTMDSDATAASTTTIEDRWIDAHGAPIDNEVRTPLIRMVFPSGPVTATMSEVKGQPTTDWQMSSPSQVLTVRLIDAGEPVTSTDVDREASAVIEALGEGHVSTSRIAVDGQRGVLVIGKQSDAFVFQVIVGGGAALVAFISVDDKPEVPASLRSLLESVDFAA